MQNTTPTNATPELLSARVTAHRESESRLDRIERMLAQKASPSRNGRKWRNRFLGSMIALVAVSALAVAAITTATTNFSAAKADVYNHDESLFTIVSQGMDVTASAAAAAGNAQGSAIEMAPTYGAASSALSAGDWFYTIDVKEAANASVAAGTFKVELFQDGTSKGALYIIQGTADATSVEGVSLKWSLGASLTANAAYVIKVSAV